MQNKNVAQHLLPKIDVAVCVVEFYILCCTLCCKHCPRRLLGPLTDCVTAPDRHAQMGLLSTGLLQTLMTNQLQSAWAVSYKCKDRNQSQKTRQQRLTHHTQSHFRNDS